MSPNNPSVQSDVTLIDIITGMFARLNYTSGGHMSISFPRELAEHARNLVSKSRDQRPPPESNQWASDLDQLFTLGNDMSFDDVSETLLGVKIEFLLTCASSRIPI